MAEEGLLVEVTNANFEEEVLKSELPILVDFWAPWCGPCQKIAPLVEEIAQEYKDKLKVAKLNVDDNADTAVSYGVRSIPTLLLFKDGKLEDTMIGLTAKERLEEFISKVL